jgi:hypothetical protein
MAAYKRIFSVIDVDAADNFSAGANNVQDAMVRPAPVAVVHTKSPNDRSTNVHDQSRSDELRKFRDYQV